jgi:hypothetical protein
MNDVAAAARAAAPVATAECPICRTTHPGTDSWALKKAAKTPQRLKELVKRLDANGLATSYGPGKWTIRQLVCHLRDCEIVYGVRWRLMLSEIDPPLQPFDQDHWADATRYAKQDADAALAAFAALRASNLEMLKLAGAGTLARRGLHPEYGPIGVGQMARHLLAHDEKHLGHVGTARDAWLAARKRKKR